jgi:hypothetical protein
MKRRINTVPTFKQTATNRRNAQKSTGPNTSAGRAAASRNAIRHGILAFAELTLPWESATDLEELHRMMLEEWNPHGITETSLVETMVSEMWRIRRYHRVELGLEINNLLVIASKRNEETGKRREFITLRPRALFDTDSLPASEPESGQPDEENVYVFRPSPEDLGEAFLLDSKGPDSLTKLRRYFTSSQNNFYKAMHELQQLQARRKGATMTPYLNQVA